MKKFLSILTLSLIAFSTNLRADAWVLTNGEEVTLKTSKGYLSILDYTSWGGNIGLGMSPDICKWKVIKVDNKPNEPWVNYQDRFYLYSKDYDYYLCRDGDKISIGGSSYAGQKKFVFIKPTDPGSGACVALEPSKSLRVKLALDVGGEDKSGFGGIGDSGSMLWQDCIWVIEK